MKALGPRALAVAGPDAPYGLSANGDSPGPSGGGLSPPVDSLVLPSPSLLPGGVHSLPTPSPSSSSHPHRLHDGHGGRGSPPENAANKDSSNRTNTKASAGSQAANGKQLDDSRSGSNGGSEGRRTEDHYAAAGMVHAALPYATAVGIPQAPGSPPVGYAAPYYMAHVPAGALVMGLHHAGGSGSGDNSREGSAHGANNSGAGAGRDSSSGGGGNWRGSRSTGGGAAPGNGMYGQQQVGSESPGGAYGIAHFQNGAYVYGLLPSGILVPHPKVLSPVVGSPSGMDGHHMAAMLMAHGPSMAMSHVAMGGMGGHHIAGMHPYPAPRGHMGGHHMGGPHAGMGMHPLPPHHHNHGYPPHNPHAMPGGYGGGNYGQQPYGQHAHGGPGSRSGGGAKSSAAVQQAGHGGQKPLQPGRSGGSGGLSAGGGSGNVTGANVTGRDSPTAGRGRGKAERARVQEQRDRKPCNARAPSAVAACAARVPELECQLQALLVRLTPGQEELEKHQAALQAVSQLVASRWPEVKVHLFGSAANGLCIAGANAIDITLEVPGAAWDDHAAKAALVTALGELAAGGPLAAPTEAAAATAPAEAQQDGATAVEAAEGEAPADVATGGAAVAAAPAEVATVAAAASADAAKHTDAAALDSAAAAATAVAAPMQDVTAMPKARTPVVKLTVPETQTRVDITVNNLLAISNTRLVADYCRLDRRLHQLARLVKHWARTRGVNDAYRGSLSSYAYVLLCVWLLQQRRPPVLPVLQQRQPHTYDATVGPWRCSYNDQVDELRDFGTPNNETVAELLVAFFDHWAWRHDYNGAVVCVRTGGTTTKAAKEWTKRQGNERHLMCIEDPFELSHDLGRTIDKAAVQVLRREFERAARIFATNPDPLPELLLPLTPEEEAAVTAALQSRRRLAKEKEKEKERAKLAAAAAGNPAAAAAAEASAADGAGGDAAGGGGGGLGDVRQSRESRESEDHSRESEEGEWSGEVSLPGSNGVLAREPQAPEPAVALGPEGLAAAEANGTAA